MPQSCTKAHPAVTVTNLLEESDLSKIPATALFVPTGEHFLEWHHKNDSQSKFSGGGESLQSNVILASWLSVNNITQLIPSTLIPIGVLILLYNMFVAANPEASKNQQTGGGHDLADHPLVREWKTVLKSGGTITSPADLVPFALVLGRDVLKATLNAKRSISD